VVHLALQATCDGLVAGWQQRLVAAVEPGAGCVGGLAGGQDCCCHMMKTANQPRPLTQSCPLLAHAARTRRD
jgi:hypothetical protein